MANRWRNNENNEKLLLWAPKSLQMMTAAMKLKDACSLEEERKKMKSLSRVRLFVTPWTVAHQAPPSMEFSRQEYWSGCH